jgi:proline racemase
MGAAAVVMRVETVDAHVAGTSCRLVVGGFPSIRGKTMVDKVAWAATHADAARRAIMLEPRGFDDLHGVVLTEPVAPGSQAGLLFMRGSGFTPLSIDAVIAAATIAIERGLMTGPPGPSGAPGPSGPQWVFDTAAGTVRVQATLAAQDGGGPRVSSVSCQSVPSFVETGGLRVSAAGRVIQADIAFSGAYYAIVDAEAGGLPLASSHRPELRRAGAAIAAAIETAVALVHPLDPRLRGLDAVIFTSPPGEHGAHVTTTTVYADGQIERSPCGNATAALMAVLDAMGWLPADERFVHEGPVGTRLTGRIAGRTEVRDRAAIVPEISGAAWPTGEHRLIVHEDDPLAGGFTF